MTRTKSKIQSSNEIQTAENPKVKSLLKPWKFGFRILTFVWFLSLGFSFFLTTATFAVVQGGLDIAVLNAGVGARALGMGGAFTAIADNADAPYWNPAGLVQIQSQEVTTMQTRLSTDTDHYYVSYATKFLKGAVGLSWIQISLGSITQTTTTDAYNEVITTSVFSYFSNAFMLAYGLPLNPNLSFGLTAKYLTSDMVSVAQGQAYGYSVTPGFLMKLATCDTRHVTIGFKVDELINEQKWGTGTKENAPPIARLGVALKDPWRLPAGSTLALDISQMLKSDYSPEVALGYEWAAKELALRCGFAEQALTAGAGFQSGIVILDYAYVQQTSLSRNNVHRISLSGKW